MQCQVSSGPPLRHENGRFVSFASNYDLLYACLLYACSRDLPDVSVGCVCGPMKVAEEILVCVCVCGGGE